MSSDMQALSKHGNDDQWSLPTGPSSTPPPPGFQPGGSGVDNMQPQHGEALRSLGGLSGPPPPGFIDGQEGRNRTGNDMLWSTPQDKGGIVGSDSNGFNHAISHGRTSSYSNLAAALGSSLADSMDDATREIKASTMLTDSFFFEPNQNLSRARQSRHAASRLLGTSPSKDAFSTSNHTAIDAGSLFAPMNSGSKGFTKRGIDTQGSLLGPNLMTKDRGSSNPTSALAAAFSSDSVESRFSDFHPSGQTRTPPGSSNSNGGTPNRSRLPMTKDLGVTVMEPSEGAGRDFGSSDLGGLLSTGRGAQRSDDGVYELERNMKNLWSGRNDAKASDRSVGNSSTGSYASEVPFNAEADLRPFVWDVNHNEPSRALAILRAGSFTASEVRAACEAFGVLDLFRADFSDKGVFFASYYDLRSAQYAASELQHQLQRLKDRIDTPVLVQFCVPLNSSSQNDDSLVVLTDVPLHINIDSLASMLSSFGAVRSLRSLGGNYGGSSFVVEFHDIQDAKQAVLELESTQPWGPDVTIEVGARNPADRKRGRDILALIGRWRHGHAAQQRRQNQAPSASEGAMYGGSGGAHSRIHGDSAVGYRPSSPSHASTGSNSHMSHSRYEGGDPMNMPKQATQLVLGPDGRYSYVVVNQQSSYPPGSGGSSRYPGDPPHQRVVHGSHGTYVTHVHPSPSSQHSHHNQHQSQYWSHQNPPSHHLQHTFPGSTTIVTSSPFPDGQQSRHYPGGGQNVQYYTHVVTDASSVGSHSQVLSVTQPSVISEGDKDNRHLMLDLDAVENGRDSRTSLMVRNIPNKYTQQMLLSEFSENGHGPGIIDFFYLPIDFKNRCNRGYAFINFVDFRDILPFHRRYYGKHWRTFNSDKICDITYARIQGKSAMLKRFENSALMEKDDEYKPLVFVSHGPEKGARLPFPDPTNKN